jgi:hypothetical protein
MKKPFITIIIIPRRRSPQGLIRNLSVESSGKSRFGRGCPKVVEHHGLVNQRKFAIHWNKPNLDLALLAQLRGQEFGSRQICKIMGAMGPVFNTLAIIFIFSPAQWVLDL